MEHEKCYVFQPDHDQRPAKRRRTELQGLQASWPLRRTAYRAAWSLQRQNIDDALQELYSATISEISAFLDELVAVPEKDRIPTAIVLGGADITSHAAITQQITNGDGRARRRLYASLSSNSGSNLKATLKTIIQKSTSRGNGVDDDEEDDVANPSNRKGPRLLNYDLEILANYAQEHGCKQVIIAFEDTEAFDSNLLSDLIELMGCWLDRIPFVCIFNIATSVDFLQQRLSSSAVRCLNGWLFDVAPSAEELQRVLTAMADFDTPLRIGSGLLSNMLERHNDYIQSIDGFVDAVQYAYMSHYYANALSIFLIPDISFDSIPSDHFQALRNLDSFRGFIREQLDNNKTRMVRKLLDSNSSMHALAVEHVSAGQRLLANMNIATDVIRTIQQNLANVQVLKKSTLYVQAMSGKLSGSASLRTLLLTIRKSSSDISLNVIKAVCPLLKDNFSSTHATILSILTQLEALLASQASTPTPLHSSDNVQNATLRPTLIAKKIGLSAQKSALSEHDTAYTALLRAFTDAIEAFFTTNLINPKDLLFHEIFIYDLKSPHREVFTPRPRHAVERALAAPHDYLDCECCVPPQNGEEATLSASQPATAVLYQLYLESGSLINVHDLWVAFQAVMSERYPENEDGSSGAAMALFMRALAELRYLGMVKNTRKRVDHVAKVAWRGL